jgi:hypothetical protein
MLKSTSTPNTDMPTAALTNFNKQIFYDESIPEDRYTPIEHKAEQYISADELTEILAHKFKANKSSGLS